MDNDNMIVENMALMIVNLKLLSGYTNGKRMTVFENKGTLRYTGGYRFSKGLKEHWRITWK